MLRIVEYLSGEVPGGLPVLLALLLAIHLTISLLRNSILISKAKANNTRLALFTIVILTYITAWMMLRPPLPRTRIVVLPTLQEDTYVSYSEKAFVIPECIERLSLNNLENKYLLHRWKWMYETLYPDSIGVYSAWENLARNLNAGVLIRSQTKEDGSVHITVEMKEEQSEYILKAKSLNINDIKAAIIKWPEADQIFINKKIPLQPGYEEIIEAQLALLDHNYKKIEEDYAHADRDELKLIYAKSLLHQGLRQEVDRERIKYTGYKNKYFESVKRLLYPMVHEMKDPPEVAVILGQIALWEENFEEADLFLKKALVDDVFNSRIYYHLSSLLSVRLRELGYESRAAVLEKAIALDPAFNDAAHALANEYYLTGTGTQSGIGTTRAIRVMEDFLQLQSDDPKILSLLATTYLKTDRLDEAYAIYEELQPRFPGDSNVYYNMGIVFFMKKDHRKALNHFLKAISLNNNLDAYLYAGLTYRMMGERDSALTYYRERVKRKTGDDDIYAKEAMAGIRIILEEIERENLQKDQHAN